MLTFSPVLWLRASQLRLSGVYKVTSESCCKTCLAVVPCGSWHVQCCDQAMLWCVVMEELIVPSEDAAKTASALRKQTLLIFGSPGTNSPNEREKQSGAPRSVPRVLVRRCPMSWVVSLQER